MTSTDSRQQTNNQSNGVVNNGVTNVVYYGTPTPAQARLNSPINQGVGVTVGYKNPSNNTSSNSGTNLGGGVIAPYSGGGSSNNATVTSTPIAPVTQNTSLSSQLVSTTTNNPFNTSSPFGLNNSNKNNSYSTPTTGGYVVNTPNGGVSYASNPFQATPSPFNKYFQTTTPSNNIPLQIQQLKDSGYVSPYQTSFAQATGQAFGILGSDIKQLLPSQLGGASTTTGFNLQNPFAPYAKTNLGTFNPIPIINPLIMTVSGGKTIPSEDLYSSTSSFNQKQSNINLIRNEPKYSDVFNYTSQPEGLAINKLGIDIGKNLQSNATDTYNTFVQSKQGELKNYQSDLQSQINSGSLGLSTAQGLLSTKQSDLTAQISTEKDLLNTNLQNQFNTDFSSKAKTLQSFYSDVSSKSFGNIDISKDILANTPSIVGNIALYASPLGAPVFAGMGISSATKGVMQIGSGDIGAGATSLAIGGAEIGAGVFGASMEVKGFERAISSMEYERQSNAILTNNLNKLQNQEFGLGNPLEEYSIQSGNKGLSSIKGSLSVDNFQMNVKALNPNIGLSDTGAFTTLESPSNFATREVSGSFDFQYKPEFNAFTGSKVSKDLISPTTLQFYSLEKGELSVQGISNKGLSIGQSQFEPFSSSSSLINLNKGLGEFKGDYLKQMSSVKLFDTGEGVSKGFYVAKSYKDSYATNFGTLELKENELVTEVKPIKNINFQESMNIDIKGFYDTSTDNLFKPSELAGTRKNTIYQELSTSQFKDLGISTQKMGVYAESDFSNIKGLDIIGVQKGDNIPLQKTEAKALHELTHAETKDFFDFKLENNLPYNQRPSELVAMDMEKLVNSNGYAKFGETKYRNLIDMNFKTPDTFNFDLGERTDIILTKKLSPSDFKVSTSVDFGGIDTSSSGQLSMQSFKQSSFSNINSISGSALKDSFSPSSITKGLKMGGSNQLTSQVTRGAFSVSSLGLSQGTIQTPKLKDFSSGISYPRFFPSLNDLTSSARDFTSGRSLTGTSFAPSQRDFQSSAFSPAQVSMPKLDLGLTNISVTSFNPFTDFGGLGKSDFGGGGGFPPFPSLNLGGFDTGTKRKKGKKLKSSIRPSFTAEVFNIRGSLPKSGQFGISPFRIRAIPKNFKLDLGIKPL